MAFVLPDVFPSQAGVIYGGRISGVAGDPVVGAPFTTAQFFQDPATETEQAIAIPSYAGDEISVVIPESTALVEALTEVSIGTTTYERSLNTDTAQLQPGQYTYDRSTRTLTIKLGTNQAPTVGTNITYKPLLNTGPVKFDRYTGKLPDFFYKWRVEGKCSFRRQIEADPSGRLQFTIKTAKLEESLCDLAEGTLIPWNGHVYAVGGRAETTENKKEGLSYVSIPLRGPFSHLLDEQVKWREGSSLSLTGVSTGGGSTSNNATVKSATNVSLFDLLKRAGIPYSGPKVTIKVDKNGGPRRSTTPSSEFNRARSVESFVYLSGENLEFRTWYEGRKVHHISHSEILNSDEEGKQKQVVLNLEGNKVDGRLLYEEYKNRELIVDRFEGQEAGQNGSTNVKIVLRSGDAVQKTASGNQILWTPPPNADRRTAAAAFDLGGETKNSKYQEWLNGVLIAETDEVYGYAYKCSDYTSPQAVRSGWIDSNGNEVLAANGVYFVPLNWTSVFTEPSRLDGWGLVRKETTQFVYDDEGFIKEEIKTIETQRRFKQEGDERQSNRLQALIFILNQYRTSIGIDNIFYTVTDDSIQIKEIGPADPETPNFEAVLFNLQNQLGQYDFFPVVEKEITTYTHEFLDDYYPNRPVQAEGEPRGRFVTRKETRYQQTYLGPDYTYDPNDQPPDVVTGVDTHTIVDTDIVYPTKGTPEALYDERLDIFQETTKIVSKHGQNLRDYAVEGPDSVPSRGRPGAPRLEVYEEVNPSTPNEEQEETTRTLMNTPNNGLTSSGPIESTIDFPSAYTLPAALRAAKIHISIENTFAMEIHSNVFVQAGRVLDEGDRVIYDGKEFIVLSVVEEPNIESAKKVGWSHNIVSWGRYFAPKVDTFTIKA